MNTADIAPLIVAAITSLTPVVLGFLGNMIWKAVQPEVVKYLGQKNAAVLQSRVNEVLNAAIGFAVQHGAAAVQARGPIHVDTKNWMVEIAVNYACAHAPDLMAEAGNVTEKVLARFDTHPAVQGLVTGAPAEPAAA